MEDLQPRQRAGVAYAATVVTPTRPIDVQEVVVWGGWAPREDLELGAAIAGVRTVHWVDEPDLDLGNLVLTGRVVRHRDGPYGRTVQALTAGIVIAIPSHETLALDSVQLATYADPLGRRELFAPSANGVVVTGSHRIELGAFALQGDVTLLALDHGDPILELGEGDEDAELWMWTQLELGATLALGGAFSAGGAVVMGFPAITDGEDDHAGLRIGVEGGYAPVYVRADVLALTDGGSLRENRTQLALEVRW